MLKQLLKMMTSKPKPEGIDKPKQISAKYKYKKPALPKVSYGDVWQKAMANVFQRQLSSNTDMKIATLDAAHGAATMDGFGNYPIKGNVSYNDILPVQQLEYFSNASFIGYNLCALLSQHWLISKCCLIPARDAVRNGYELAVNDGTEVDPKIIEEIRRYDVKFKINHNLIQLVQMGRIFGIRVAMFAVDFGDPDENKEFYENPFNIDAVTPGSYKGISQIDPYWMTYQLDGEAAGDPASINFYEPTWWIINNKKIHYTHLVIFRTEEVPDILKTTYFYGGIPIPQKIFQRVYAAERCANEVPMLLLTKRTSVMNIDITEATAEEGEFQANIERFVALHNNFGVKTMGLDEKYSQHDTTLSHVEEVTMMQYQLVASAANVPSTKLLGTTPKGFSSTGEYEEASYHEELESIQAADLTPLLDRHHELLIKSVIAPEFNMKPFRVDVAWASLDAMTAVEQADLNKKKAETDNELLNSGAISADEIRERITKDPDSGYSGLIGEKAPEADGDLEDENPQERPDVKNDYG